MPQYIGREIGGYRIIEKIGSGGMAKVYKAYQAAFDRFVALKILPETYADDETYLKRFQQEARVIARLEHRHILPVHDFGEDGGLAYLAMRYLQAGTLKDLLTGAPDHKLPLMDTVRIVQQIASALDYAHEQGIVHRDVKPSNVLVDRQGDAYLMDFGIAKVLEGTQHLTSTGASLGTPAYMSPEQGRGKAVDGRSDIYSLGIMLYQMLVGRVPFEADTPLAIVLAHVNEPLPIPTSLNPEIPDALERVVLKALAKKPEDRYQTAVEMAAALAQAVGGQVVRHASEDMLALSGQAAVGLTPEEVTLDDRQTAKRLARQERMRKVTPWAVGAVVVAVIGTLLGILKSQSDQLANVTINPTQAAEMMAQATGTQLAIRNATATQARANHQATRTLQIEAENSTATVEALIPTLPPTPTPVLIDDRVTGADEECLRSAAWAADGSKLAGLFCEGNLVVWNPENWEEVYSDSLVERGTELAISPGGRYLAVGDEQNPSIRLLDLESGALVRVFRGHTQGVLTVSFSPDSTRLLSGSDDYTVRVWDVETGEQLAVLRDHEHWISDGAWSGDGRYFVTVSADATVRLWDAQTYEEVRTFYGHVGWVDTVDISLDGELAASGSQDRTARIWDTTSGTLLQVFKFQDSIRSVQFSPDDAYLAAASSSGELRIYDTSDWSLVYEQHYQSRYNNINGLAFSPDGSRLALAFGGGRLMVIDLEGIDSFAPIAEEAVPIEPGSEFAYGILDYIQQTKPDIKHSFRDYPGSWEYDFHSRFEGNLFIESSPRSSGGEWQAASLRPFESSSMAISMMVRMDEYGEGGGLCGIELSEDRGSDYAGYRYLFLFDEFGNAYLQQDHGLEFFTIADSQSIQFEPERHNFVTVIADGNRLALFSGNELVYFVEDEPDSLEFAEIFLSANGLATCQFDNFQLWNLDGVDLDWAAIESQFSTLEYQPVDVIFEEDFDDGGIDQRLSFNTVSEIGGWEIVEEESQNTALMISISQSENSNEPPEIITSIELGRTGYFSMSFRFMMATDFEHREIALNIYNESQECKLLGLGIQNDLMLLSEGLGERVDGSCDWVEQNVAQNPIDWGLGEWHSVRIDIFQDEVSVFFDGVFQFVRTTELIDPERGSLGRYSILVYGSEKSVYLDDIQVIELISREQ